ncbi:glycosyl transferase [Lysobacter arseniciresistens ZS79]|uniref:Glycosyl transferase n=1 Tax=Lysobacter arseniciresistens ZS79 TaxID=913325 RepID=A0A0A0EXC8_9GAMM|nr:glycosyl transferase [Lysobacter arseniciresistens ZS79]
MAAVVVTHQSESTLDDCLRRLRAAAGVGSIRVVDNQSSDDTLAIAQRHASADPRVRFIANPDNPGFGVGCNQGAADAVAGAPGVAWLAFVNPDAMVAADTLARLRTLAAPRGEVLLGVDLVGEDGVRDPAARRRDPDFGAMLARLAGRRADGAGAGRGAMAVAVDDGLELQPVDAVSGALMFMPRGLFERLDGFDEGYRLHAEDLDLCRRARLAGANVAVANRVRVLHVRGVSSRSRPLFVEWHKHRGLWRYFGRFEAPHRGWPLRAAVWAAIWLRFPLAAARAWWRSR